MLLVSMYQKNGWGGCHPHSPMKEQQRIVAILDKFETLVNDISEGLPVEIAARRQQYEYYRDKLLTFKRKEDAKIQPGC